MIMGRESRELRSAKRAPAMATIIVPKSTRQVRRPEGRDGQAKVVLIRIHRLDVLGHPWPRGHGLRHRGRHGLNKDAVISASQDHRLRRYRRGALARLRVISHRVITHPAERVPIHVRIEDFRRARLVREHQTIRIHLENPAILIDTILSRLNHVHHIARGDAIT